MDRIFDGRFFGEWSDLAGEVPLGEFFSMLKTSQRYEPPPAAPIHELVAELTGEDVEPDVVVEAAAPEPVQYGTGSTLTQTRLQC